MIVDPDLVKCLFGCTNSDRTGYTPEVFPPSIRGTACGIASALSRLAGIFAPLVAGLLMVSSIYLPMYLSVVMFMVSCGCMILLPLETRQYPNA